MTERASPLVYAFEVLEPLSIVAWNVIECDISSIGGLFMHTLSSVTFPLPVAMLKKICKTFTFPSHQHHNHEPPPLRWNCTTKWHNSHWWWHHETLPLAQHPKWLRLGDVSRALQNIISKFVYCKNRTFSWGFQAETLYVCPKPCFGHTHKVSA